MPRSLGKVTKKEIMLKYRKDDYKSFRRSGMFEAVNNVG